MKNKPIVTVHDVAAYILSKQSPIHSMQLHRLLYYCQAWSLVWDNKPLFPEPIQAWANSPILPAIWDKHKRTYTINTWRYGDSNKLNPQQRETVESVLNYYKQFTPETLADLIRREEPRKL